MIAHAYSNRASVHLAKWPSEGMDFKLRSGKKGGGDYGEKKEGEKRVGHNDCRRLDEFGKLKMVSVRMLYPKPP